MKKTNKNVINLLAFSALIIVAVLVVVNNLLPIVGVNVSGPLFKLLATVEKIFTIIVIGLAAYNFVAGKTKTIKIIYWVAVALFIVGVVLVWF